MKVHMILTATARINQVMVSERAPVSSRPTRQDQGNVFSQRFGRCGAGDAGGSVTRLCLAVLNLVPSTARVVQGTTHGSWETEVGGQF